MLEDAKLLDQDYESNTTRVSPHITIGDVTYATGLFWQPLQNTDDPVSEVSDASSGILEGADLFCIKQFCKINALHVKPAYRINLYKEIEILPSVFPDEDTAVFPAPHGLQQFGIMELFLPDAALLIRRDFAFAVNQNSAVLVNQIFVFDRGAHISGFGQHVKNPVQ